MKQCIYILITIFSILVYSCLFEDSSEKDDSVWERVISESSSSHSLKNGFAYRLYAGKTGEKIEFSVSKTVGTEGKDGVFGIVFWFINWDNYYALDIGTDCSFSLIQCSGGKTTVIGSGEDEHALKKGRGAVNVIKMTLTDGLLHIYANCPNDEAGSKELFELNYSANEGKLAPPDEFTRSFGKLYFRAMVPPDAEERQVVSFRMISPGAEDVKKTTDYKNGFQNADGTKRVFYCDEESWSGKAFFENTRNDFYEKCSKQFSLGIKKLSGSQDCGRGFAFCYAENPLQYYFFCIDSYQNYWAGKVYYTGKEDESSVWYYHADDEKKTWQKKPGLQKSELLKSGTNENTFYVEAKRGFFTVKTDPDSKPLIECLDETDTPPLSPEKGTVCFLAGVGDERYEDLKHEAVELEFRMIALKPKVVVSKKTEAEGDNAESASELSLADGKPAVLLAEEKTGCTGKLSYQWYVTDSENEKKEIPNACGKEYTVTAEKTGTYTYTCKISNTVPTVTKENPSAEGEGEYRIIVVP